MSIENILNKEIVNALETGNLEFFTGLTRMIKSYHTDYKNSDTTAKAEIVEAIMLEIAHNDE